MFSKKIWFVPAASILLSFLGVSTANADEPQCYTVASLRGNYAVVATYGANIAIAFAKRYLDGNGNLTGRFLVNAPTPGSTTGARTIITGTQVGTYTVNCNGTGVFTRVLTASNGTVSHQIDDFVIRGAKVEDDQLIATAIEDAQRTPSALVPGGIFVIRSYTRLPNQSPTQ